MMMSQKSQKKDIIDMKAVVNLLLINIINMKLKKKKKMKILLKHLYKKGILKIFIMRIIFIKYQKQIK